MDILVGKGWRRRVLSWVNDQFVSGGAELVHDRIASEVAPFVPEGARVACVGCGSGAPAYRMAQKIPWATLVGIDRSSKNIQRAGIERPPLENLEFCQSKRGKFPLPDASVDVAVSCGPIRAWPNELEVLKEMLRILRLGGLVALVELDRDCSVATVADFVSRWEHPFPGAEKAVGVGLRQVVARRAVGLEEVAALMSRAGVVRLDARRLSDIPYIFARARRPSDRPE